MNYSTPIERLQQALQDADAVVIGAGAGLSTSAGFTYSGERFERSFSDFIAKYHYSDMYSAGFYPYQSLEEYWAYWSRHIFLNRYVPIPKPVYSDLFNLVRDKDYFVITTNVDHCFQKSGFDKKRLFYTQGDYGLFQCVDGCGGKTYDNEPAVRQMVERQHDLRIPSELIPRCPLCGKPMTVNLRCDNSFVEDEGWHLAKTRYEDFLHAHKTARVLYLELGVGGNTPVIIKYPFWRLTAQNPKAIYTCINLGEAVVPHEIQSQSICMDNDIGTIISSLR
ncbi:SIR2 family NAD-dependent protein deacylase [Eubacterium barkeri]|uniref:NAD-dependent protein deacetylase, SIR2 family n=1 Tax=Eubacterium barkeri TaxID=1528 RepID=A0A1H3FQL2_EUBBA|nr:NAD-dependent protein deacetylase, SIR2 family [Eubacterium barkeri]